MRYPITIVLMTALGGLTGISVCSVLLVSAAASYKITLQLTEKRAELIVAAIERGVSDNLAPAQNLIRDIARRVADGSLDLADRNLLAATISGALAPVPQLGGVVIWQPGVEDLWIQRTADGQITERGEPGPTPDDFDGIAAAFSGNDALRWGAPTYFDNQTFVDLRLPLKRDGVTVGVMVTGISLTSLSTLVGEFAIDDLTPFILFGDDKVLAHPALLDPRYAALLTPDNPVLSITGIGDPVLAAFPGLEEWRTDAKNGLDIRESSENDDARIILSRISTAFGTVPWRIGAYVPITSVNSQFRLLWGSIVIGFAMLVISLAASLFLARRMARPIRDLSAAAEKIEKLDLESIAPLKGSSIRELDEQARSFNRMTQGLRWFQAYVPRRLVRRLMEETSGPVRDAQVADVTVMFTDVVGFSALTVVLPPSEIVALLNAHFEIINGIVEAEGGTLDKFIGDAAMSFWGAPDPMPDHAARACRAALAIAAAVTAVAQRSDRQALHIKIGLHSGPVTVGNIGALTRMNYTVIGDTVNVCARIESLAGTHTDGSAATILVSGDLVDAAGEGFVFEPIGDQHVKGRAQAVSVLRLVRTAA